MRPIEGKKVCVVGGAGFLGSHLVNQLIDLKCEVTVLDNLSVGRMQFVNSKAVFMQCDIKGSFSNEQMETEFQGIDYVFNYSSMPYIPVCLEHPIEVINTNTLGALRVVEAAHKAGVKRILQVSSAEVYGNTNVGPRVMGNENSGYCTVSPISTYGISKAAIDLLCQYRFKEAGVPVIILRQFNCVGERETHPYVIPEIIDQIHKANVHADMTIAIRLGANTRRDFMYAGDATAMAIELLEHGELGQTYDLGSESNITIHDLARLICEIMRPGCKLKIEEDKSKLRPCEIWSLKSDNSKIANVTFYKQKTNLEEALKKTIAYFEMSNHDWGWK